MPIVTDQRSRQRKWDAKRAHTRADIHPLPKVQNSSRKSRCKYNLRLFLETYFPNCFSEPFSADHIEVIEKTQRAVLSGGFFAVAMPRGSGKTSIHQRAAIWAIVYGHVHYVYLVCADGGKAKQALKNIKTEFEYNPQLFADFPEVCYPIRMLQGVSQAARKQHINGRPTLIDWTAGRAQLPSVRGSKASGAIIGAGGITGAARGAQVTMPDGSVLRPTLLLVDDFQTRESAASLTQCKSRLDTLTGDLAGMRGPNSPLAILATATVIYDGDAADQLMDRERYPEWNGTRKKLVYAWPEAEDLWSTYLNLRRAALRVEADPIEANEFYAANREAMDQGAKVAWPSRYDEGELSAIQHAYNLRLRFGEESFLSEYQNTPHRDKAAITMLTAKEAAAKVNGYAPGVVPSECSLITAMIDVQGSLLYWMVCGWQPNYTGYVLDYGSFPEQPEKYFSLAGARYTLRRQFPGMVDDAAIFQGLQALFGHIFGKEWIREDGAALRVGRCLCDANWGPTSELVNQACRQSPYAGSITPSYGRGIKATQSPISQWRQSIGMNCGPEWVPTKPKHNQLVGVIYDTWYWKTRWHNAFAAPLGTPGCISLFNASPEIHQMLSEHVTAGIPKQTRAGKRMVYEWEAIPNRDDHFFDVAVGCMVGASLCGLSVEQQHQPSRSPSRGNRRRRRARQH